MGVQRWSFHPDDAVNLTELDPDGRHAYQGPYDFVLAADHDRIVVEAEARGWNAGLEAAVNAVDDVYPVSDQWGHHTLPHIDRRQARAAIAALRKPEVEG